MKKLTFSLLFFSAIAWLWIGHMMGQDGTLVNISGTTTVGGSATPGNYLTNNQSTATTISNALTVSSSISVGTKIQFPTNGATISLAITNGQSVNYLKVLRSDGQDGYWQAQGFDVMNSSTPGTRVSYLDSGGWHAQGADSFGVNLTASSLAVNTNLISKGYILSSNSFVFPTNYVAANFSPIPGCVTIVSSNGVLYKVTQLTTNLLSALTP